jgi:hypothetical protein
MSDDRSIGRFLRGLTIGALLGAIIAGSRLWGRRPSSVPHRATGRSPGHDTTGASAVERAGRVGRGDQGERST